jgi:hypothetical protein
MQNAREKLRSIGRDKGAGLSLREVREMLSMGHLLEHEGARVWVLVGAGTCPPQPIDAKRPRLGSPVSRYADHWKHRGTVCGNI